MTQRLVGRILLEQTRPGVEKLPQIHPVDGDQESLPCGEVPVKGALTHPGLLGNRLQRGIATAGELLTSDRQNALTVVFGVRSPAGLLPCHGSILPLAIRTRVRLA